MNKKLQDIHFTLYIVDPICFQKEAYLPKTLPLSGSAVRYVFWVLLEKRTGINAALSVNSVVDPSVPISIESPIAGQCLNLIQYG